MGQCISAPKVEKNSIELFSIDETTRLPASPHSQMSPERDFLEKLLGLQAGEQIVSIRVGPERWNGSELVYKPPNLNFSDLHSAEFLASEGIQNIFGGDAGRRYYFIPK